MPRDNKFLPLQGLSRQRKYNIFMEKIQPKPNDLVLDLGGSDGAYLLSYYPWPENIILFDIDFSRCSKSTGKGTPICGNALSTPFNDGTFDIVWCNALIEHVGDFYSQQILAKEIHRIGRRYFVTTPWKGFPVELHFQLPLYQFVPKNIQKFMSKKFAIGWYKKGEWESINLLWHYQMRALFPDATVVKHRVSLWPETIIAYKDLKL